VSIPIQCPGCKSGVRVHPQAVLVRCPKCGYPISDRDVRKQADR
jgi:predicted RNA-binding Zn-ribbon protein involved in translation (DUF1610 family)